MTGQIEITVHQHIEGGTPVELAKFMATHVPRQRDLITLPVKNIGQPTERMGVFQVVRVQWALRNYGERVIRRKYDNMHAGLLVVPMPGELVN